MNRRSIFKFFCGIFSLSAINFTTARHWSDLDELKDGKLPCRIWLGNGDDRWYSNRGEDLAPADAMEYIEVVKHPGSIRFFTTGRSGQVYTQNFVSIFVLVRDCLIPEQIKFNRKLINDMILAEIPKDRWLLSMRVVDHFNM